eukprot:m.211396 g.211396  ORF g.211396 m.211396 type:complete len:926 (+) comp15837_c0_seq6:99-2876(+)
MAAFIVSVCVALSLSHSPIREKEHKRQPLACTLNGNFTQDNPRLSGEYGITQLAPELQINIVCLDGNSNSPCLSNWKTAVCIVTNASTGEIACQFHDMRGPVPTTTVTATVTEDCGAIQQWSNGAPNWEKNLDPVNFSKIHVVYMTHLDLGFTGTTRNVVDKYFDIFFPQAFETAQDLRKACVGNATLCPAYKWTQFPWLIQEFLDGAAGASHRKRTPDEIKAMEEAILNDDIIWHANAVNWLTEVADKELFSYGISMKDRLNSRFNKTHGNLVIEELFKFWHCALQRLAQVGKLTDTTGMSRSAITTLAAHGVKAFHIGYNGVGGLPIMGLNDTFSEGESFCGGDTGCPAEAIFRWQDPSTNAEILMMIENNYGSEIDDLYPGRKASIVRSPTNSDTALIFHYTQDNSGVPTMREVQDLWTSLQKQFPNATIMASSLDAFVQDVYSGDISAIPVIKQELGNSWNYGAAADPIKLATFREARRFMTQEVAAGSIDTSWWQYDSFMRRLMKGPCEHNWGLSIGSACADCRSAINSTWSNAAFHAATSDKYVLYECPPGFSIGSARWGSMSGQCGYGPIEQEWAAQREWMHPLPSWAYEISQSKRPLNNEAAWMKFVANLEARLLPLRYPQPASTTNTNVLSLPLAPMKCGNVVVGFDELGSITHLANGANGISWADETHVLGNFSYVTYSQEDFDVFAEEWNNHGGDFAKPGMDTANQSSNITGLRIIQARANFTSNACRFVFYYEMADPSLHVYSGAPALITKEVTIPGSDLQGAEYKNVNNTSAVDMTITWHNKTKTRLPEASFVSFVPAVSSNATWALDILGYPVNPLNVIQRGTRYKHAVWSGASVRDNERKDFGGLQIRTLDTALMAVGDVEHLLRFSVKDSQPNMPQGGVHPNLHNNLWGTAFPQWYGDDLSARFQIVFE